MGRRLNAAQEKLLHKRVTTNYSTRFRAQKLDLAEMADADMELAQLSDLSSDFGRITAGVVDVADGTVVADDNGLTLVPQTAFSYDSLIKWVANDGTGYLNAFLEADYSGSSPNRASSLILITSPELGGSGDSRFSIRARMPDGVNYNGINVYTALSPYIGYQDQYGNNGWLHLGDYTGYVLAPDDTSENELYFRTAAADSLGSNGFIHEIVAIRASNTVDATNYTVTPRIKWGGSTVFSPGTLTFSANTQRQSIAVYEIFITNVGDPGSQELILLENRFTNQTVSNAASGVTPVPLLYRTTASVDTTSDATFAVTVQKSSADTDLDVQLLVLKGDGPIYD